MNENITGQVTRLSTGCPKPDNWFSGIIRTKEKGEILAKGKPGFQIEVGMRISATIIDVTYTKKGNAMYTLNDASIQRMYPSNEKTIINFLSGPDFKGIGFAAAKKLYETFGANVFEVIKNQPDRIVSEAKLTDAQKSVLVYGLMDTTGTVMSRYPELRRSQAVNLLKYFSNDIKAMDKAIVENVYQLVGKIRNFDFDTADRIFLENLKHQKTDKARLCPILKFTMEDYISETGHNYANVENGFCYNNLLFRFNKKAGIQYDGAQFRNIIYESDTRYAALKQTTIVDENNELHLYLDSDLCAQKSTIQAINTQRPNFPVPMLKKALDITLASLADPTKTISNEQKIATGTSLAAGISIICGGPGRGKSALIDVICHTWKAAMGLKGSNQKDNILLIAPTGRAAKNLSEKTGLHAITAARLTVCQELIYKKKLEQEVKGSNLSYMIEGNLMSEHGLAIIDECSMIGTRTMGHLLQILSLWFHMQVILVGDPEQLPAIENGSPFLDMINSNKIPVSRLTTNFRTHGKDISENAERICAGDINLQPGPSFHTAWFTDNDSTSQLIMHLYYQKMGINPNAPAMPTPSMFAKTLLLCPLNKGTAGIHYLNSCIQDMINPETPGKFYDVDPTIINSPKCTMDTGYAIPGTFQNTNREHTLPDGKVVKWTRLRIGDRVVNTENNPEQRLIRRRHGRLDGDEIGYEEGINNGDRGVIVRYTKAHRAMYPSITVKLDNGLFTDFYIDPDDPSALKLSLGYALTVHKAQGSEAETVIISMPCDMDYMSEDMDFATRNLLNTAVTRAMDEAYIIGSQVAVNKCILNPARKRDSTLTAYL